MAEDRPAPARSQPGGSRFAGWPFVQAALAFALGAGFLLAIALPLAPLTGLAAWRPALLAAHGQAQLYGWTVLFIVGVGLHFLPRLRGVPLARSERLPLARGLLAAGLALAVLSPPIGLLRPAPASRLAAGAALAGQAIYALGLWRVLTVLGATVRGGDWGRDRPAWRATLPYLATGLIGLIAAIGCNGASAALGVLDADPASPLRWHELALTALISGTLIPVSLGFAARTLPLFLRLAVPPADRLASALAVYLVGLVGLLTGPAFGWTGVAGAGSVISGVALLLFLWWLDVPLRRRIPWTAQRAVAPLPRRRPTRPGLPDHGEYGRFEWLIRPAFGWLALAALLRIGAGITALAGGRWPIPADAERHAVTMGFVTLLILGMGVRLLPGFAGRRPASPRLVEATVWLGNGAALLRLVPLLVLPWGLFGTDRAPVLAAALGLAGLLAWLAVGCLALNLARTFR